MVRNLVGLTVGGGINFTYFVMTVTHILSTLFVDPWNGHQLPTKFPTIWLNQDKPVY